MGLSYDDPYFYNDPYMMRIDAPALAARLPLAMSRKKSKLHVVAGKGAPAAAPRFKPAPARASQSNAPRDISAAPVSPTVSGRWLLKAVAAALLAASLCTWGALCLLFGQGSWQLLYHPMTAITRTPASARLAFDSVGFDPNPSGTPTLCGWWIAPAPDSIESRYTVLFLHGEDGNLSSSVDNLAQLHAAGVNVFAFDYRGYGQSQFVRPSETHWLEDAGAALRYLTATRHIDPHNLVVDGSALGANLALELATAHPDLAGVVAESPLENATSIIFNDARARLVPAHWLAHDRWDLTASAAALRVPSLWFLPFPSQTQSGELPQNPAFFEKVPARKMFVWLPPGRATTVNFADEFSRWLDSLAPANTPVQPPVPTHPQTTNAPRKARHSRRPSKH
jgi:pimeloyl-ACP methyl ester carboxylesterase